MRRGEEKRRKNKKSFVKTVCLMLVFCVLGALLFAPLAQAHNWNDDPEKSTSGGNRGDKSLKAGDPVVASNGAYGFRLPLLDLGGPMDLHFTLIYRSDLSNWIGDDDFPQWRYSPFWWSPKCVARLWTLPDQFWLEDFRMVAFNGTSGEIDERHEAQPVRYVMNKTDDYVYLMDPIRERVYIFNKSTELLRYIMDRNGNKLTYSYNGDNLLTQILDGLGRELNFTHTDINGDQVLTKVTDREGREIRLNYEENGADNDNKLTLRSVTDALGNNVSFNYTTFPLKYIDLITKVTNPEGNTPYTQEYTIANLSGIEAARVSNQTDAYGNEVPFSYDPNKNQVDVTWADNNQTVYQHYSHHEPPKEMTDAEGRSMEFTRNEHDQMTSVTDRFGDTTNFSFHQPTGKIASIKNNKGDSINYTYTAQEQTFTANPDEATFTFYNLARVDYPGGTHEEFTYDAKGNVLSYTDRGGKTWQYEYNARGQVTRITNPAGGVTDFTYNAVDATLASSTDSDIGVTTYGYDTYKRLNKLTHPGGTFVRMDYDLNDLITGITDERGKTYNYTYDANGNLANTTDPAGNETKYAHDLMDRITQSTNHRDKTTQYAYDSMSRLASVTDPNGNANQLAYDARGWLNRITDPAGNVWQLGYGDEGLLNSLTTPLGYTTSYTRDKLGYITGITNPLGHSINFTRDEMTRIAEAEDALGRKTNYTYDERGFLISVTRPDVGTATYTRNDLALLTNIRDQNGKDWALAYTSIGRLQNLTDPVGNEWQYAYNERGFLDTTTYPTGETQDRTYDGAGNLVRRLYSDGTDLQFTYDDLNRLTAANGIEFTYNEVGRVVATTNPPASFGATYDDSGRRATATYADGIFTVTYQYNSRDLHTSVTDDLTGTTVEFTHDDDGRLTGITRSNGANTTFTWDAATRLTRIRHDAGTVADLQYEYNAAGEITKMDYTLPLDPADHLTSETNTFTYDDASQVSSAGYSYDTRGRQTASPSNTFTWDSAGRLIGTGEATLAYNGLGDLVTRTAAGTTTHYYYNYALGLNPIVAEKDEGTGNWTRFYVLSPAGQLLYLIDASDSNKVYSYHFDRNGNTLFLTDAAGAVTDSYAYTPYGKLLHHEGANDQPFTFLGQWGVRQEDRSDGLYHIRARYYDASTARFLSREPLWPNIVDVRQLNPYQYAVGEPINSLDVTGMAAKTLDQLERELEDLRMERLVASREVDFALGKANVAKYKAEDLLLREDYLRERAAELAEAERWRKRQMALNKKMELLERQIAQKRAERGRHEKGLKAKVTGTTEFANLPGLGWQRGGGVLFTPDGNLLRADRLMGDRVAAGKLDNKLAGKLYLIRFKGEDKKDVKLSFDWKGSGGSLKVQPFQLARMR